MKLTMLLADAVQAVNGKLYVLGGGWSITGPEPAPSALAIKIEVPWDEGNKKHHFRLALLDDDGRGVMVPGGQTPVEVSGDFEAGRPAGLKPGTPLDVVLALNVGPLLLESSSRYVWRCWIDEQTREEWEVSFSTRAKVR
jgi:uncharacterized protein DUF6941